MNAFRSNGAASRMDFLPPERRGRPASARAVPKRSDIVDAEFETVVSPGRRHVYPVFNDNRARPAAQSGASARSVASAFGWVVNHVERLLQTGIPQGFRRPRHLPMRPGLRVICQPAAVSAGHSIGAGIVYQRCHHVAQRCNGMKILSVYGAVEITPMHRRPCRQSWSMSSPTATGARPPVSKPTKRFWLRARAVRFRPVSYTQVENCPGVAVSSVNRVIRRPDCVKRLGSGGAVSTIGSGDYAHARRPWKKY